MDDYMESVLKLSVAQIIKDIGFDFIDNSALDLMTELAAETLENTSKDIHSHLNINFPQNSLRFNDAFTISCFSFTAELGVCNSKFCIQVRKMLDLERFLLKCFPRSVIMVILLRRLSRLIHTTISKTNSFEDCS